MVSRYRDRDKKEYDAGDFRRMVRANHDRIDRDDLRRLADRIWEGAGEEIEQFVEIAMRDGRFPCEAGKPVSRHGSGLASGNEDELHRVSLDGVNVRNNRTGHGEYGTWGAAALGRLPAAGADQRPRDDAEPSCVELRRLPTEGEWLHVPDEIDLMALSGGAPHQPPVGPPA